MLTPGARKCRRLAVYHDAADASCLHYACRQTVDVQREHSVVALAYGDGRPDSPSRARGGRTKVVERSGYSRFSRVSRQPDQEAFDLAALPRAPQPSRSREPDVIPNRGT